MKSAFVVMIILVSVLSLNCRSNHESEGDNKPGTGPGSGGSSTKPTPQPKSDGGTEPGTGPDSGGSSTQPPPQPTLLSIESVPSGASVEIGVKRINDDPTPGTGRNVGVTPVTVALIKSDINPQGFIEGFLKYQGYHDFLFHIGGLHGRLEPGKTHKVGKIILPKIQSIPQPKPDGDTKPDTAPRAGTELVLRPTLALIESVPSGASVEIGLKTINSVVTPGTGRNVGVTPVTVELRKSDLSPLGNVDGILRYRGYSEKFFQVPTQGRLESGKKHNVIINLKKIQ